MPVRYHYFSDIRTKRRSDRVKLFALSCNTQVSKQYTTSKSFQTKKNATRGVAHRGSVARSQVKIIHRYNELAVVTTKMKLS